MFEQLVDGVRKASESSIQMQQEMFRNLTRLWLSQAPGGVGVGAGAGAAPGGDWNRMGQKRWVDLGLEMLNKHRETLDTTYKTGIQLIEQTFHVTDVKSSDDYRKLVEDLWRKLFDLQKDQSETQLRDFQAWLEKSSGIMQDVPRA